ncbi:MAG: hypothetical protein NVS2B17_33870 [Candidatus Velthaea sp.]
MKTSHLRVALGFVAAAALAACNSGNSTAISAVASPAPSGTPTVTVRAPGFSPTIGALTVTSATFANGAAMPASGAASGCGGSNISPQLSWTAGPAGTLSYVVTEYDPDAPTGSGFWHWTIFNIPSSVTSLAAGANSTPPAGSIQGYTDYGSSGYGGPCPPVGDGPHRYNFQVLALDEATVPGVTATSTGTFLTFNILTHVIARGTYQGTYAR